MITKNESAPVVIKFQIEDYSDALHFADQADRDQYSDEQIEAMCQARYDNWLAVINAPRPEPTAEQELAERLTALIEQKAAMEEQITALSSVVEAKVSMRIAAELSMKSSPVVEG